VQLESRVTAVDVLVGVAGQATELVGQANELLDVVAGDVVSLCSLGKDGKNMVDIDLWIRCEVCGGVMVYQGFGSRTYADIWPVFSDELPPSSFLTVMVAGRLGSPVM